MVDTDGKAPSKDKLLFDAIKKYYKHLKFQSPDIVKHIFFKMQALVRGKETISWDIFKTLANEMIPRTIEQKIDLFVESYIPHETHQD
jgi:hypothetical protein